MHNLSPTKHVAMEMVDPNSRDTNSSRKNHVSDINSKANLAENRTNLLSAKKVETTLF